MAKRMQVRETPDAIDFKALDWRQYRAIEMAKRKAQGWHIDKIARFYRIGRTMVYREMKAIPPEILARITAQTEADE